MEYYELFGVHWVGVGLGNWGWLIGLHDLGDFREYDFKSGGFKVKVNLGGIGGGHYKPKNGFEFSLIRFGY